MAEARGIKIGDEVRTFKDETARDAASAADAKAEQALTDASEALQETVQLEADLPNRIVAAGAALSKEIRVNYSQVYQPVNFYIIPDTDTGIIVIETYVIIGSQTAKVEAIYDVTNNNIAFQKIGTSAIIRDGISVSCGTNDDRYGGKSARVGMSIEWSAGNYPTRIMVATGYNGAKVRLVETR